MTCVYGLTEEEVTDDVDLEGPSLVTALGWFPGNNTHTSAVFTPTAPPHREKYQIRLSCRITATVT